MLHQIEFKYRSENMSDFATVANVGRCFSGVNVKYKPGLKNRWFLFSLGIDCENSDLLEVAGRSDVGLSQLLLLAFGLLVLPVQAAVAQHVVAVVRLLVEANVVDLWILDVHRGHGQSQTCRGRN